MLALKADPRGSSAPRYSESRHALCCLNCGFESEFVPHLPDSIGKPLYVLMVHDCPSPEIAD